MSSMYPSPEPQLEHVLQAVDQVLGPERHLRLGDVLVELAVDAEPADAAQAVAVLVVELLVEQRGRLLQLRRVAGAEPGVDPHEGVLVAGRRVVGQRVEDQRVQHLRDHVHRLEVARLDLGQRLGDLRPGLDQLLAALGVDDAGRGVVRVLQLGRLDRLHQVELADDRFGRAVLLVQRPDERRRRDLARLVDADGQRVLLGDAALDPRPPLGDHAAAVQRPVALLLLDQEVDAGAAVQLVDDDPLGPVDDELAAADHDRDLAEVDGVLHHLVLVLADEPHLDAERHAERQPQGPALVGRVPRLGQVVADVLQPQVAVVALDREHLPEQGLQAEVAAVGDRHLLLEELLVALDLDVDQVRDRQGVAPLGVVSDLVDLDSHRECSFRCAGGRGRPADALRAAAAATVAGSDPQMAPAGTSGRPILRRSPPSAWSRAGRQNWPLKPIKFSGLSTNRGSSAVPARARSYATVER